VKKLLKIALALLLILGIGAVGVVLAGQVYGRDTVTLGAATGTGSFTNGYQYAALKLVRIWNEANILAANTVTVTRVLSGTTYTQAVGSVAFTSGSAGSTASFTAGYLKYGDQLLFSSTGVTGSTCIVEYEVQEH